MVQEEDNVFEMHEREYCILTLIICSHFVIWGVMPHKIANQILVLCSQSILLVIMNDIFIHVGFVINLSKVVGLQFTSDTVALKRFVDVILHECSKSDIRSLLKIYSRNADCFVLTLFLCIDSSPGAREHLF